MQTGRIRTSLITIYLAKLWLNTGARFVYPFLPAIARGLGVPLEAAGLLLSVRWLAGLATPIVVKVVSPAEQRRRLALLGMALGAAGAAITTSGLFSVALAGFVLIGIGKPTADVAFQAYLADEIPYHERGRAIAFTELAWGSSLLFGAPLAGWLLATWGWQTPFGVIATATLILMVPIHALVGSGRAGTAAPPPPTPLRLDRSMLVFLLAGGLFALSAEFAFVVFGAWLEDAFDATLVGLGATAVAIALGEIIGEGVSFGFADRVGKRRVIVAGLAVSIVGYAVVPMAGSLLFAILAFTVALGGFEVAIVSSIPLATELAPGARTRFLALMIVSLGVLRAIGTAMGVPVFNRFGITANMWVAIAANLIAMVLIVRFVDEQGHTDTRSAGPRVR
jgi:predicted MFS family arabinose efflux permease